MLALVMQKSGRDLASALRARNQRLVLAESCTAGRIAAVLGEIAGISEYFCGSAVAYRNETKAHWLDVPRGLLADPGPVSETVARHMVTGVLARTPEADWAGAITGHLGPDAPQEMDGQRVMQVRKKEELSEKAKQGGCSNLREQVHYEMNSDSTNGFLNPEFVEWLMGFPQGWTEID